VIELVRAPAYATVQDGGRGGWRAAGVPPGGALDVLSLRCGNALLGNTPDAAALECALTGGTFRARAGLHVILTGAVVEARLDGRPVAHGEVLAVPAGGELRVEGFERGRCVYVCVAGGIDVPLVLGGRGTYLPGAFGGLEGRLLRAGDVLPVGPPSGRERAGSRLPERARVMGALGAGGTAPLAVLRGPQADVLSAGEWADLLASELTLDPRSDRIGYRLTGAPVRPARSAEARSEPACVGAVQLTPDGTLIVLMPDGPTVGGYPKIAVVATAELPRLAQLTPGERVALRFVQPDDARAALRAVDALVKEVAGLAGGTD
jgi:biotin-dependent carboxylase-like uncharacterized protein